MESIGTFEAKTHLARLLDRVAEGEQFVITKRGRAVAMLVPPEITGRKNSEEVGREMLAYRDRVKRTLGGSFRDTAHEGHRY